MGRANVRLPEMSIGDMWAQISGLRTGEKRIHELCEKYNTEIVDMAIDRLLESSAESSRRQVAALPEKHRAAIHLHYGEGYSVEETARILGATVSAVKMRLKRGREALRREWEDM